VECHLRRIDFMVRTIVYISMYTNYRESSEDTSFHSFLDTFANCRDVLLRNSTTNNCGLELVQLFSIGIHRLEFNFTVTILSTTTRLFRILTVYINSFGDCLFVSNLRCTNVCLNLELTKKTVNDDIQVKLTHTSDNSLSCFLICMSTECRVLLSKLSKCLTKFALSSFSLRLDSELDNWLRELHGLKDYRMLLVTDCITCCSEFESDCCSDITGVNLIQLHTFVGVHLKDTSNTLFFIFCGIQYIRTGVHCS